MQPETRRFRTKIVDNPFSGEPRPELEQAWHDLLKSEEVPFTHQQAQVLTLF